MAVNFVITGYSIRKEICTTIPKYEELGNYFECQKPVIGDSLEVELKSRRTFEICEVEVFQTKTGKMHNFESFSNRRFFINQDTHDCKRLKNFAKYLKFVLLLYRSTIC